MKGIIFDIQHFSIQDGPGIRTTVFFKGCPLDCIWCHNPESKNFKPQLSFVQAQCIYCGGCSFICPSKAHTVKNGMHYIDFSSCKSCGLCVNSCPTGALAISGTEMTTQEVMDDIIKDREYYKNTGGGVTFSGGEAMAQFPFLLSLAKLAKSEGLHIALETSGFASKENYAKLLPYIDLILLDYKLTSEDDHKTYVGVSRSLIDGNMKYLCNSGKSIVIRCPIIPTINDNDNHFKAIANLEKNFPTVMNIELLPYHNFGKSKAKQIGNSSYLDNIPLPNENDKASWLRKLEAFGAKKVILT